MKKIADRLTPLLVFCSLLVAAWTADAETGADAWLRYARLAPNEVMEYKSVPEVAVVPGESAILASATTELVRGVHGILGKTLRRTPTLPQQNFHREAILQSDALLRARMEKEIHNAGVSGSPGVY